MRSRLLRLVLPAVLGGALMIPVAAQASLPWLYGGGSFDYASGTTFTFDVLNTTTSSQTVEFFSSQHTVAPNGLLTVAQINCGSGPCPAIFDFTATSPDLAPFVTAVESVSGYNTPVFVGPGQFRVYGPNGSVENAVAGLAGADSSALGSLQSATSTIQGLVAGVPGSLAGIAASSTSAASAATSSPVSGQLQALSAKVDHLSAQVAALTKALTAKPVNTRKKKPGRRKKHA